MSFQSPFDPDGVELPVAGKTSLGLPCTCDCHLVSNTFHCVPCCDQTFKLIREISETELRPPVLEISEIKHSSGNLFIAQPKLKPLPRGLTRFMTMMDDAAWIPGRETGE